MDLSVQTTEYQVEKRDWLLSRLGTGHGENPSVVIKTSLFVAAGLAPNGYIPSGIDVGIISAETTADAIVVGPYDAAASDGRETAWGLLYSGTSVPAGGGNAYGSTVHIGFVKLSRLPRALSTQAQADLKLIHFTA